MSLAYQNHPAYKHFEAITRIPHGSGNEKALSDYILRFAQTLGLSAMQDAHLNLVIQKPASPGYEKAPVVMLQGHLDMVCEKNMGSTHDFERDALRLVTDGDFLHADGTTLGADDGVAVAYALALMEDSTLPHPALEFVLTADEEVGLVGATLLDPALLHGDILINLDSGEEGIFLTSCAGGLKLDMALPLAYAPAPVGYTALLLRVTGLMGGHSGIDIDKNRGNSIKLMTELLAALLPAHNAVLASFSGGAKDNAIPREAEALILVPLDAAKAVQARVARFHQAVREILGSSDPLAVVEAVAQTDNPAEVLTDASAQALLAFLAELPCGALRYSNAFPGLVETSNNVGVVRTNSAAATVICALRSSVAAQKKALDTAIRGIAAQAGASVEAHGEYPEWEYNPASKIRKIAIDTYEKMSGGQAQLLAVHAGLECGLFAQKRPGLDMIALGPDMYDIHSPAERLSIPSFLRTWDLLAAILAKVQ